MTADRQRAAILAAGGNAINEQTCVIIEEDPEFYTIKAGAAAITLQDGRRLHHGETARIARHLIQVLP